MSNPKDAQQPLNPQIALKLAIARQHTHNASFAGSARHAIAEGFSAIDSVFSALLIYAGVEPPRNHRHKLDRVRELYPDIFNAVIEKTAHGGSYAPGVSWDALLDFYQSWLSARYDEFSATAAIAGRRTREAQQAINCALRFFASEHHVDYYPLSVAIDAVAFGHGNSAVSDAIGEAHERRFAAAEAYGEAHGSKLGTKFAETSNYCELSVVADDPLTQAIIEQDDDIANACVDLYEQFNRIVEDIQQKRLLRTAGTDDIQKCEFTQANEVPNFLLSLKMRYHGASIAENGERWGQVFATGLDALMKGIELPTSPPK